MIHLIACFFLIGAREVFDAEIRCDYAVRPELYRSILLPNYCPRRTHTHTHVPNLTLCPGLGPRLGHARFELKSAVQATRQMICCVACGDAFLRGPRKGHRE